MIASSITNFSREFSMSNQSITREEKVCVWLMQKQQSHTFLRLFWQIYSLQTFNHRVDRSPESYTFFKSVWTATETINNTSVTREETCLCGWYRSSNHTLFQSFLRLQTFNHLIARSPENCISWKLQRNATFVQICLCDSINSVHVINHFLNVWWV